MVGDVRVFRDTRAILGESPWWRSGALFWCDITEGLVHISPEGAPADGSADASLPFPPPLASFQPAADGSFVIALGDRVILADAAGHETSELARIRHATAGLRLNEGKCDPQGRFLVGSMNLTTGAADGALYLVSREGATLVRGGFGISNGFEWSLDERIVYVTDTAVKTIYRADWHPGTGPGDLVPFAVGGTSDGLTIDDEGCLWNARYGDGCVVRLSPDGDALERVELPVPNVTGLAFGGPDLSTLYVCSAREHLDEAALAAHPLSGAVFAVDTRVHGRPVRTFGG